MSIRPGSAAVPSLYSVLAALGAMHPSDPRRSSSTHTESSLETSDRDEFSSGLLASSA